jgi:rhodanese-related sulfurtransferase
MAKLMSVVDLKKNLDQGKVTLIDVRNPEEYQSAAIEGAHLIPLSIISVEEVSKYPQPIVIHCHSGKRSETACHKLLAENASLELFSLEGGIVAWMQAGYPIKN